MTFAPDPESVCSKEKVLKKLQLIGLHAVFIEFRKIDE